jgi:hypothetical protein
MGDAYSPPVVCKYCGSREEPLTVHGSIICSCGAVLDEVFADASDFTGWGTSSGRNSGTDGQINTWLTVAKKGGKGAEVAAARKLMAKRAREVRSQLVASSWWQAGEQEGRHRFADICCTRPYVV